MVLVATNPKYPVAWALIFPDPLVMKGSAWCLTRIFGSDDWRREKRCNSVLGEIQQQERQRCCSAAFAYLLHFTCIYSIHPLCKFRTPTWLSRCWQFDLLRHVFAGLTYQSKRCNKKYCASPYWDVRHVWCRVMNCVCAWTLRPMPIWRMPMYASSVQVCQLYHVISLMYTYVYLCYLR